MKAIQVQDVHKSYGDNAVLKGLTLDIGQGETFALLGPNGAGKTTLVEILEGYRKPDGGLVEVLGADPAEDDPGFRSRIGIVLQQTTSFENFTVGETVDMFAGLFPDPLSTTEALGLVGLGDRTGSLAVDLSGGQRRRLDVACGLVGRPELLFLDEPTTGLDPEARRALWEVIRRLRNHGTTVLLTTHYLDEAEYLADRIGILLDGRLAEVAPPAEIGRRHTSLATVRFVPPVEINPGTVDGTLSSCAVEFRTWDTDGTTVSIETAAPTALVAELSKTYGELAGLTVTRPSLEDIYLNMVRAAGLDSNSADSAADSSGESEISI